MRKLAIQVLILTRRPSFSARRKAYLTNKGVTAKQVGESLSQVGKMIKECKWQSIGDISASSTPSFLGDLRRDARSVQTYNHYLKSVKQFTLWLARDPRTPSDPLFHVSKLKTATDHRHDRRALSPGDFHDSWIRRELWNAPTTRDVTRSFHRYRHLFITSLEPAGISPKMAQTLARHSDIRPTLQTYTHVELSEQVAAIQSLKGPGKGFQDS